MGKIGGDDEDLTGTDDLVDGGTFFAKGEEERALGDVGDLLVGVLVAGNEAAFLEHDASEHGLCAGDKLAGERGVELLGGDVGPTGVKSFSGHHKRVPRVEEKDICGQGGCCRVRASDTDFAGAGRGGMLAACAVAAMQNRFLADLSEVETR